MKNKIALLALTCFTLFPLTGRSWSEHGLLTRVALKTLPEVQQLKVVYTPLEDVIPAMQLYYHRTEFGPADPLSTDALPVLTPADLNLFLRIKRDSHAHQGFTFDPRLGEFQGKKLSAAEVISHYSDEPDGWTDTHYGDEPDTFLFDDDQYGNILWRPEYAMMGGRDDGASQAFRHMWWAPWSIRNPISTFKLPLGQLKKGMGEADERAFIYIEVSRRALKAGSRYWQMRFMGNALHYLQDCTQAFHVAQTPSKKFIWMATPAGGWKNASFKMGDITKRTTQVVAYYHYAYEIFIGRIFKEPSKFPSAHAEFSRALNSGTQKFNGNDPEELLKQVAKRSIVRSPVAAKTALGFFPPIPKTTDLASFNPKKFMDGVWWQKVEADAQRETKLRRSYFNSVMESFELFGSSVRSLVKSELHP